MLFSFIFIIGVIDYSFTGIIGINKLPLVILGSKILGLIFLIIFLANYIGFGVYSVFINIRVISHFIRANLYI